MSFLCLARKVRQVNCVFSRQIFYSFPRTRVCTNRIGMGQNTGPVDNNMIRMEFTILYDFVGLLKVYECTLNTSRL